MKKSLALLALASLFIGTTSCRKKDEPKPVVPVLPNTTDNTADATTIKNSQAVFTVPAGSIVYISPKKGLTVQSDDATEIALTKSSPMLKRLRILSKSRSASATKTTFNLSGATELEGLLISGYTTDILDLTKQTKLRYLALGGFNWKNYNFVEMTKFLGSPNEMSTDIKEVKLPANNVIEYVAGRTPFQNGKFDIDNLPRLTSRLLRAKTLKFSLQTHLQEE